MTADVESELERARAALRKVEACLAAMEWRADQDEAVVDASATTKAACARLARQGRHDAAMIRRHLAEAAPAERRNDDSR